MNDVLSLDLSLTDSDVVPFWDSLSTSLSSFLWLPHRVTSSKESNYAEVSSSFWKKLIVPKTNIKSILYFTSPRSLTPVDEDESDYALTSKKIRIYPKDEDKYFKFLHLYRRAYNLTIERFKSGSNPSSDLRREIISECKALGFDVFNTNLIGEAFRRACETRSKLIRKRSHGEKCDYHFKSWKYNSRYFLVEKVGVKGSIYKNSLGLVNYSESVPLEAVNKNARVGYENGRWYISVKQFTEIKPLSNEKSKIVSLDPGSRTFITAYNQDKVTKYGDKFVHDRLAPIMNKIYKFLSFKDRLLNDIKQNNGELKQYMSDQLKWVNRKINAARAKQHDLVDDLHRRVAFDLVTNNDVILLPEFKTKQMVKKRKDRKLTRKSVRWMLSLRHYQFKLTMLWMAKKYGKKVIEVNEAFTSRTMFDGTIKKIGRVEIIKYKNKEIDRDINGARNILIRFLSIFSNLQHPRVL